MSTTTLISCSHNPGAYTDVTKKRVGEDFRKFKDFCEHLSGTGARSGKCGDCPSPHNKRAAPVDDPDDGLPSSAKRIGWRTVGMLGDTAIGSNGSVGRHAPHA